MTPLDYSVYGCEDEESNVRRDDLCTRTFVRGKPQCSLQRIISEGNNPGWVVEPYFLARRGDLPRFDPVILYGHLDKMDQIRLMAVTGWRFGVSSEAYLVNDQSHATTRLTLRHVGGVVKDVKDGPQHNNVNELQEARLTSSSYYAWWHHVSWLLYHTQKRA